MRGKGFLADTLVRANWRGRPLGLLTGRVPSVSHTIVPSTPEDVPSRQITQIWELNSWHGEVVTKKIPHLHRRSPPVIVRAVLNRVSRAAYNVYFKQIRVLKAGACLPESQHGMME